MRGGLCLRSPFGTPQHNSGNLSACPGQRATTCLCLQCNSGKGSKGGGQACAPHPGPVAASLSRSQRRHSAGVWGVPASPPVSSPSLQKPTPVCRFRSSGSGKPIGRVTGAWDLRFRDAQARVCGMVAGLAARPSSGGRVAGASPSVVSALGLPLCLPCHDSPQPCGCMLDLGHGCAQARPWIQA